jgi:hypothetical protein
LSVVPHRIGLIPVGWPSLVEECWGWHAGVELNATIMDLYVFYGFLVGVGIGAFTVSLTATVTRWFVTHRGLAVP